MGRVRRGAVGLQHQDVDALPELIEDLEQLREGEAELGVVVERLDPDRSDVLERELP